VTGLCAAAQDGCYELVLSGVTPDRREQRAAQDLLAFRCDAVILRGSSARRRSVARLDLASGAGFYHRRRAALERGVSRGRGPCDSASSTTRRRKGTEMSRETLSGPHHSGGVASGVLHAVAAQIREQVAAYCESTKVPGYVVGVYHDGAETVVAHGLANVVTGAPMREDTGFLFGSVTKVLTATLVLQQVERGIIDLAERVIRYLPEFQLTTPGAAEKIRVRHLLTHTSGIDADLFFPDAQGSGALSAFLDGLGRHCGSLFEPDEFISYSNGGMIVAGRLLEVLTGTSYHELLKRELYATSAWMTHPSLPRKQSFVARRLAISLL
jgi:CubicO group peptidase (beta-lactamase class C family)